VINERKKAVAWWLITGVVMIIVQTLLGGITRLTGSGLSITKWNPLFGILPPLNTRQWNEAFEGYKKIGQFRYLNSGYTLPDFKSIFFWEWLHRFWARMLGIVFATGFIYFLLRNYFSKQMIRPFVILFILGGLQGLLGWLMVKSGINQEDLYVNYTWLAAHFLAAMVLACYTLWFALQLLIPQEKRVTGKSFKMFTLSVITLLFIQLMYGAFMAGLKAAMAAPTWPDINGMYIPHTLFTNNLLRDTDVNALKINIHFMHRTIAYLLFALIIVWFIASKRLAGANTGSVLRKTRLWPLSLVILQVGLGIATVLCAPLLAPGKFGTFQTLAELHQMTAMFLLMALVVNFYVVSRPGR
jgi:cytochrome c oxidase assembly protein subunit 15